MSGSAISPRPDQISELTQGVKLPLPGIQADFLKIIATGLYRAYCDISSRKPQDMASGSEVEVTALMESNLNHLIEQDQEWGQLVLCVARGKESLSFDGSHLEKRPDLSIYLTNRERGFPLVVEVKIIDAKEGKTEKLYCEQGVCRFINGDYSWGTREAFMMAYVRDGSSIEILLKSFLSATLTQDPLVFLAKELPSSLGLKSVELARSKHDRAFTYVHHNPPQNTPGSITLWHLWLH